MKFLFAPDSFKGSFTSKEIIKLLSVVAKTEFPDCEIIGVPIADGGEGTVDTVIGIVHGRYRTINVKGPLGETVAATYGVMNDDTAIIEMAAASGLTLVPLEQRNPLYTTSYGTGQLILDALTCGYTNINIAIGGSATNDGGIGAMKAMGVCFLDKDGNQLEGFGSDLDKIAHIDISGISTLVEKANFTVMCDVTNPLVGPEGATYIFGPQKGAGEKELEILETGMNNYVRIIENIFGVLVRDMKGAGAAGGLGAALCVFLNAKLQSGIQTMLDLIKFNELLIGVDLVITGEGMIDHQSTYGKVPCGIGMRCKEKHVPVVAIVGSIGENASDIYKYGVNSIISTVSKPMDISEALKNAEFYFNDAAERLFKFIKIGIGIRFGPRPNGIKKSSQITVKPFCLLPILKS